ncbi:MAG: PQQ-like beta-propeller repeat protein [Marinobacter sp.]|nr:PQQ-like beta-propeller repeat protein [Marinobacter sp.]
MRAVPSLKTFSLFAFIALLAACTAAVTPQWVATYNHKVDQGGDRITWLNDMVVDSFGNVVVAATAIQAGFTQAREEEALLVQFGADGQRHWAQAANLHPLNDGARYYDDTRALVTDNNGNLYAIAISQRVTEDSSTLSSHLVSFDRFGQQRWTQHLSDQEDMRALALQNGQVIVAGLSTQRFSLDGTKLSHVEHPNHNAWAIAFDAAGNYVLSGGFMVSVFNASGDVLWQAEAHDDGYAFAEVLFTGNGDLITAQAIEPRGAALITRWTPSGQVVWQRTLAAPVTSYGMMGPALIRQDHRGDLYVATSNSNGRRIAKLDAQGRVYWQKTSRQGIVQDMALINGEVFVVGNGRNEKYDTQGNLVAESSTGRHVQITQGRVAVDGDRIYAGYAASMDGGMGLHVSQFRNQ